MTNGMNEYEKLENALFRAGREMAYPATPAIAVNVRAQLTREPVAAPRPWLRVFVPLAAALILALALLLFIPVTRDAVAQFLGLNGLRIFYATPTPTAQPTPSPLPSPTPRAASGTGTPTLTRTPTPRPTPTRTVKPFTLCCETTLADAQQRARFKLLVPPNEMPSRVYYQSVYDNGEQVVMVFGDPAKPRFTLYQAQQWIYGKIVQGGFGKLIDPQTVISETTVRGKRALWFTGAPHLVMMLNSQGEPIYETERTVDANTLAWETGTLDSGIIYRIETKLSLAETVKLAESLVNPP